MCNSSSNPKTTVTDPLADQKTQLANMSMGQYGFLQPYSRQFADKIMPNLGNFNWNQAGATPDTLVKSDAALNDILSGGGSKVADAYSGLKQNLLGVYDTGVQKYSLDPLKEQLVKQGIYSSGPGMDAYQNAATNAAQQRGLLGSQADTQMLDLMSNFINQGQGLGQTEFNIGQILGLQNPLQAFQAANSLQAPFLQDIATTTQMPQNNSGALGMLAGPIIGPTLMAALQTGNKGSGSATASIPTAQTMQQQQNLMGPSSGNAYNPLNSQSSDISAILNNPALLQLMLTAAAA